jgi:hypothetical protein
LEPGVLNREQSKKLEDAIQEDPVIFCKPARMMFDWMPGDGRAGDGET